MQQSVNQQVDHLFRHESGKMIAVLSKLLGLQHLDVAQDIAQDTLLQAMHTWSYKGIPENPTAWLYRVAKNKAVDYLRRVKIFRDVRSKQAYLSAPEYTIHPAVEQFFEEQAIEDSELRMMFACCHPCIPVEAQIALTLKTLCGLSVGEIANAFLKDEETIAKRIYRAKEKLRTENIRLELPSTSQLPQRLDAVLHCLYLLFNEGYNSSHPQQLIREELCEEAMRMAYLLTQSAVTNRPNTSALLALFCFQASRLQARLDEGGNIILLQHQDRSKWYQPLIKQGCVFMEDATQQETSVYHLEAAIAYFHAVAPNFEATDWKAIYHLYNLLAGVHATPFILLNKAIAAAYAVGKENALKQLQQIKGLESYYLYYAAIGEIYFDLCRKQEAKYYYEKALLLTKTMAEQQLILEKYRRMFNEFSAN